jgi:serine/threonine protein kinase/WD40 repeat protein
MSAVSPDPLSSSQETEAAPPENLSQVRPAHKQPEQIGPFRILEKIGEGGMGIVYKAEQREPVRRIVALKVIKLGMDTKEVVARFEAERQALAMLAHPNVARVFEAGMTENGRPYFAMEHVPGIPLTQYCHEHQFTTKERLDIFIPICHAVQHAHQKGIIHRDLKPTNILVALVDGNPVPKVIDFGIAKATNQALTQHTLFTQTGALIGTPEYMSPEQAQTSGLDIDTRTDIFSLGVILYELLTGTLPLDPKSLREAGLEGMARMIRTAEPPKPSTRLTSLAHTGGPADTAVGRTRDLRSIQRELRGDLDWIVMKCLEKDRSRRYDTATGLAADLKRHLDNEPVLARPPSATYRFQKALRRNKLAFAATAAIILTLAAGIVISTWQATRAMNAEAEQSHLRVAAENAQASEAREKTAAQQTLYKSLAAQALPLRLVRRIGYREEVFKLLEQARDLPVPGKNLADLRREAVASLGDFVGLTPVTYTDFPSNVKIDFARIDPSGRLAAFATSDGKIHLRELRSGKEVGLFSVKDAWFNDVAFGPGGDQVFALGQRTANWSESARRLYSWSSSTDGAWTLTKDVSLTGADRLLTSFSGQLSAVRVSFGSRGSGTEKSSYVTFRLYDLKTQAFVSGYEASNTLPPSGGWPWDVTADGGLLAVSSLETQGSNSSNVVNIYDFKTGRRSNQLKLATRATPHLSRDGKYLACLSETGGAIYALPGCECIGEFKEYFRERYHALNSAFGANVVALSMGMQNRIRLWNPTSRQEIAMLDEPASAAPVGFTADGNTLLTVGEHHARVYRLATPEKLDLPPHSAAVHATDFSPDGTLLASVGTNRIMRVYDALTGKVIWQTEGDHGLIQCVAFSPDGKWLATGDFDTDPVAIWDARTGKRLLEIGGAKGRTMSVRFAPDGRYLVTCGDKTQTWEIEQGQGGDEQAGGGGDGIGLHAKRLKSQTGGYSLVVSPDSRHVAFYKDPALYLWDLEDGVPPRRIALEPKSSVQCATFTPDSRQLLMLNKSREVVTLDVATRNRVSSFPTLEGKNAQAFDYMINLSPDGSKLAISSPSERSLDIWDPKTAARLYTLPEEAGTIYWLAWSADSRRVAIARDNGNIAIWDLNTIGQILDRLGLNP